MFDQFIECLQSIPGLSEPAISHKLLTLALVGSETQDYELRKHRAKLIEGRDWISAPVGDNGTPRIYYSVSGMAKLCDLIGSDRASAFKQCLLSRVQPAPIVHQSQPMPYAQPIASPALPDLQPVHGGQIAPMAPGGQPAHYAAAMLRNAIAEPITQALAHHQNSQREAVDRLFEQQRFELEKFNAYTNAFLAVQNQTQQHEQVMADKQPSVVLVSNPRKSGWIDTQEPWALGIIAAMSIALVGCTSYVFVKVFAPRPQVRPALGSVEVVRHVVG